MFTLTFWRAALERAIKTFAQTILALVTVGPALGITHLDWPNMLGLGATAAVVSVLTSVTSLSTITTPKPDVVVETLHAPDLPLPPVPEVEPEPPAVPVV